MMKRMLIALALALSMMPGFVKADSITLSGPPTNTRDFFHAEWSGSVTFGNEVSDSLGGFWSAQIQVFNGPGLLTEPGTLISVAVVGVHNIAPHPDLGEEGSAGPIVLLAEHTGFTGGGTDTFSIAHPA